VLYIYCRGGNQKLKESVGLKLSEEGQKNLDLCIGLTLIGERGRDQLAQRIRLIHAKYKKNTEKSLVESSTPRVTQAAEPPEQSH
jgi:hypothetical protein